MTDNLWESSDNSEWKLHYEKYNDHIVELDKRKTGLAELDAWFWNELPKNVWKRKNPHLTKDELVRVVEWKLKRAKFRPRLLNLAKSNEEGSVVEASAKAIGKLSVMYWKNKSGNGMEKGNDDDKNEEGKEACGDEELEQTADDDITVHTNPSPKKIPNKGDSNKNQVDDHKRYGKKDEECMEMEIDHTKEALDCLCELRGIGPATASAILSTLNDNFAFMSDEAMQGVFGVGKKFEYTTKRYIELLGCLRDKADVLCKDNNGRWNARGVELALFSWTVRRKDVTGQKKRKRK